MNFFGNLMGVTDNEGYAANLQGKPNNELIRGDFKTLQNARQDLIGEIQAIIEYDDHIHTATNEVAAETWEHIRNEELMHVGELLALLDYLDGNQKGHVVKGIEEFNKSIAK